MSDDVTNVLLKKVDELQEISMKTAVEVAVISAKLEEREKQDHEKRISQLEQERNQIVGGKEVILGTVGLISTVLSILAYFKH
jgi:hypothetical protein